MKISLRGGGIDSLVKSIESLETELDYTILFESLESPAALPPQSIETLPYNDKIEFLQALQTPLNLNALLDSIPTPPANGWEKIKLNDKKYIELNPSKKEIANLDENTLVSFIEMASVSDNGYIINKVDKSLAELKKGGYTYFKENDILIAKITPCMENGKCALATNLTNNIALGSTEFHIFRAKSGLKAKFLFLCLNQDFIRNKAKEAMTGASGHRRVPISFYESLQIPIPPLEAQEKIVSAISKVEERISLIDSSLESLETQKAKILKDILEGNRERTE